MKPLAGEKSTSGVAGVNSSARSEVADADDDITKSSTTASTTAKQPSVSFSGMLDTKQPSVAYLDMLDPLKRRHRDLKVVGLGEAATRSMNPNPRELLKGSKRIRYDKFNGDIPLEDDEKYARSKVERRPIVLVVIGYYTALKIFAYYLISLNSLLTVGISVGLTVYWHGMMVQDPTGQLTGSGMDWVLLGFAVITPLSLSVGISFRRRERGLIEIAKFRSFSYQLFLAHCIWDWGTPPNGKASADIDWVEHADAVLRELISIADELCRFLTLPTASKARHRMTKSGRREAARTAEIAYRLYDSLYTRRFLSLSQLSERLKLAGLGASEASRIRQYERWMGDSIENLRMIKTYRTPQTLRSFARIFTTLLPPFFAPQYAQLSIDLGSLAFGVSFATFTALCLNALLEGVEILEDPFVAFVTLDGIDVREEFQVLHYQQLVSARNSAFPEALSYGSQTKFSTSQMIGDIESLEISPRDGVDIPLEDASDAAPRRKHHRKPSLDVAEIPLGNASEASRNRRKKRTTLPSFGDQKFLAGLDIGDDVELYRESGYQLFGRNKASLLNLVDAAAPSATTPRPPKVVSVGKGEDEKRPSSH